MRLSKSAIKSYDCCPRQYKYIYEDKLKTDFGEAAKRGIELHKKFDEFYNKIEKGSDVFDKKWDDWKEDTDTNNFLRFNQYLYNQLKEKGEVVPISREKKYFDEETGIVGIIDAVYKCGEDCILIDYKTGKYNEKYLSDYRFELAIYTHLHNKFSANKITHWGILFTKVGKLWTEKVKSHSLNCALKKVEKTKELITQKKFGPRTSPLCAYCSHIDRCVVDSEKGGENNFAKEHKSYRRS